MLVFFFFFRAPKRPMSAFLAYANSKRRKVKEMHSKAASTEISRILARMWKDAPEEERKKYIDEEFALRQEYKIAIDQWRENEALKRQTEMTEGDILAVQEKVNETDNLMMQSNQISARIPIQSEPLNTGINQGDYPSQNLLLSGAASHRLVEHRHDTQRNTQNLYYQTHPPDFYYPGIEPGFEDGNYYGAARPSVCNEVNQQST